MRWIRFVLVLWCVVVASCGGNGHSVAPPSDLVVQETGDTQVTLNWTAQPGVNYWVWFAPGTAMDAQNYDKTAGVSAWTNVTPPFVLKGTKSGVALTNETTYSFTVNARTGSGPGGNPANIVTAVPRLAGQNWAAGPDVKGHALRAVTYATLSTGLLMVGVGDAGKVLTSADNQTWTEVASSGTTYQLKDVAYAYGKYIAVGDAGTIIYSADGVSWTAARSPVTQNLTAVFYNGSRLTAVGQGGTVLTSTDGASWTAVVVNGLTQDLNAVTYSLSGYWLAAGASGVVYTSTDGLAWSTVSVPAEFANAYWKSAAVLTRTVTSGTTVTTTYLTALVGHSGQLMTSTDGVAWTSASAALGASLNLNKVIASTGQLMVVGDSGAVFTSPDGGVWTRRFPPSVVSLLTVIRYNNTYTAYGQSGVTVSSK